jgi:hypothetical protein
MTILDPTEAFFSGFNSTWSRMLLFCISAVIGHAIGLVAAYTVEGTPFEIALNFKSVAGLPASLLWQLLQNFLFGAGILYILLFVISFTVIMFTEVLPIISLSFLIVLQIWDTFFIQRKYASQLQIDLFSITPEFSNWGYAIAGLFTFIGAVFIALPFLIPRFQKS